MADFLTPARRSKLMGRIRSRGNAATEVRFVRLMKQLGITGWRRNQKIFGKPDFIFPKIKVAVFVDGCFWHGCFQCYKEPKSNSLFWRLKIENNKKRAIEVNRRLRKSGWRVLRVWQHDFKRVHQPRLLRRLYRFIKQPSRI